MFTVEVREGRLLEARVQALQTVDRAKAYGDLCAAKIRGARADRPMVLCADHRQVRIYTPAVANQLAALFGTMNARLERVALIVAKSNATLSMQLERIVREAQNPSRRVFYEPSEAVAFLGEVLDERERARLAVFAGR